MITPKHILICSGIAFPLFFLNGWLLNLSGGAVIYAFTSLAGYLGLLLAGLWISRLWNVRLTDDVYNTENESFQQETRYLYNEYSINLPTLFYYNKRWNPGWANVINPLRGSAVIGLSGSGKSFAVVNNYIKQGIEKGYCLFLYDYKFDDLSLIAYNHLLNHPGGYKVPPKFCVVNFDDPRRSHRCNPINPEFMNDIADAYEAAYIVLMNLNKSWLEKSGDFFVESPIVLFAAVIWFLKIYDDGKYCTFPHAIEFLNCDYKDIFPVLIARKELEGYISSFVSTWRSGVQEQLQGQLASAKIPLSRMISPQLYWVMSGDDFSLNINDPKNPEIMCVANSPDRQSIYSAALGLYTSRIVKLINKKKRQKCMIVVDELATMYFKGIDNLLATGRSNRIAVCLGFQDFAQLRRDYGERESKVIENLVGNIFCGQTTGETSKTLSERFGRIVQKRQSVTISDGNKSTSLNTQLDYMIPAAKISNLSQGMFVGSVADDFGQKIEQKIFHALIDIDTKKIAEEEENYVPIPQISDFTDADGNDCMKQVIQDNYDRIKADVHHIINAEKKRIKADPQLRKLLPETPPKKQK